MIYALALIGAVAVSYLVWKAFGPQGASAPSSGRGPIGPDDDTDFLLDLGRERRRGTGQGRPAGPPQARPATDTGDEPRPRADGDNSTDGANHGDDPRPGAST